MYTRKDVDKKVPCWGLWNGHPNTFLHSRQSQQKRPQFPLSRHWVKCNIMNLLIYIGVIFILLITNRAWSKLFRVLSRWVFYQKFWASWTLYKRISFPPLVLNYWKISLVLISLVYYECKYILYEVKWKVTHFKI